MSIVDRIVAQNLGVYRASPTRLQEDVQQEAQVASDYRGRLAYELLQNADDAMEREASQRDHVKFVLTDDALWVANNGRPLSDADIQGLCGLGASSKVDAKGVKRASIGHKGLGFKSVLEITERPTAMSDGIAFELSETTARQYVSEVFRELDLEVPNSFPVMRFPSAVASEFEEWRSLETEGFKTAFRFPFRDKMDSDSRGRLADNLLGLPLTTVLFLKHLDHVEVDVRTEHKQETRSWSLTRERLEDDRWIPATGLASSGIYRVNVSSAAGEHGRFLLAHNGDVQIGAHRSGLSGPAWEGVEVSEVSVAVLEPGELIVEMPTHWRRFHVFLPTEEPSPYSILVNGAFTTDLSRQAVRVSEEDIHDYNLHLIRQAAALFSIQILPLVVEHGMDHVVTILDRDREMGESAAAIALHRAMVDEVSRVPLLLTESGDLLCLSEAVFPPSSLGEIGIEYRRLLVGDAAWDGRRFPSAAVCSGRWGRVGEDHGGISLHSADGIAALADQLDPERATAVDHESGGFELDPVLEVSSAIYLSADTAERSDVRKRARSERLFPAVRNPDRTFERVSLEGETAFYPPRSARHHLPLGGLRFMAHAVCWGALNQNERKESLGERLDTWSSLFDIQEFRFEEVMRSAVLPNLRIRGSESADSSRSDLEDLEVLTAICQLAGRFPKPDRPLRYQRLGNDRALFNLSRLPVPCRGADTSVVEWVPAYRAYFGSDWIGDDSAELLSDVVSDPEARLDLAFLVPPHEFMGRLIDLDERAVARDEATADDEEEVDLDEDFDSSLESDEFSAWLAFLKWIGVNESLRPVHFHDVEDLESGWLSTKGLAKPKGWAFRRLGSAWSEYRDHLLDGDPRLASDDFVPYFYELHDLEGLVSIIAAAERDSTGRVGQTLVDHLVRHWDALDPMSEVTVALVKRGLYPSQRTKPQKAKDDELDQVGDNFWLHRLKVHSYFPTSHGPRRPAQTWLMSEDIERRFGRRGQNANEMVPVLKFVSELSDRHVKSVCTRLGVRTALTPATFTLDDARLLCRRLDVLYGGQPIDDSHLRDVIRPAYRELFELLSGRSGDPSNRGLLRDEPLLVELGGKFSFQPAHRVLYSGTPGFLQRSGLQNRIPTFVIEADPSANAPLAQLFQTRSLEGSIDWLPDPSESPFDEGEYSIFRRGLEELAPLLLARVRVERTRPQDVRALREFVDRAIPVVELGLTCELDGESYSLGNSREYYVKRGTRTEPSQVFLVWEGRAWPPEPDEAQRLAMALADALEVNLVEAFLALIQTEKAQQRRLLEIAGATPFLAEARAELQGEDEAAIQDAPESGSPSDTRTLSPTDEPTDEQPADLDASRQPAPAPVELVKFEDLWIDGEPILVFGERSEGAEGVSPSDRSSPNRGGAEPTRAAPGTDLVSLDSLGMRIVIAYEANRLRKLGLGNVTVLPGPTTQLDSDALVIDVSSPAAISRAVAQSDVARATFESLRALGVSQLHPGFDVLTILNGKVDRMIELKSSAVDARIQSMTWNEWKSASSSDIRESFWLYLAGNLRADIPAPPYLRAIRDPFGSLYSEEIAGERISRAVQLRVREFDQAEHLFLVPVVELPEAT